MQAESIVDNTLKGVQRFRILCVGRSGVGKSSLINRVFRLENSPEAASVSHWTPGHADTDKEFISPENKYIVLHDSKGFELANTKTFDDVERFIRERSNLEHLKDQLHAVWLCTDVPRASGHILEKGDEDLLRLARDTGTPVVIVLTKYDRLVKTKKAELEEDGTNLSDEDLREQSEMKAQEALDMCIRSLKVTLRGMYTRGSQTPKPRHVNVLNSDQPGYEASISSLVQVTCDLVSDKLKLMWAIAQRASREVKINACIDITMGYLTIPPDRGAPSSPSIRRIPLRNYLGRVHQDIITCWNFRDEEKTLSSEGFKVLMLYLVQDVQESQSHNGPHITPALTVDKISSLITVLSSSSAPTTDVIGLTPRFTDWLSSAVLDNEPPVQRFLMAYATDLITVLKSLFDIVKPSFPEGTMWLELTKVLQTYERLDPRKEIHRSICESFPHHQQINDPAIIRCKLRDLLLEPESPLSDSERSKTRGQNFRVPEPSPAPSPSTGGPSSSKGPETPPKVSPTALEVSPTVHEVPPTAPKVPPTAPRVSATSDGDPATSDGVSATSNGGHAISSPSTNAAQSRTWWQSVWDCLCLCSCCSSQPPSQS